MQFNPISQKLFTDNGELIKELSCPYGLTWGQMSDIKRQGVKQCSICSSAVFDTLGLSDEEALNMVQKDPGVCFRISLESPNVEVIPVDV